MRKGIVDAGDRWSDAFTRHVDGHVLDELQDLTYAAGEGTKSNGIARSGKASARASKLASHLVFFRLQFVASRRMRLQLGLELLNELFVSLDLRASAVDLGVDLIELPIQVIECPARGFGRADVLKLLTQLGEGRLDGVGRLGDCFQDLDFLGDGVRTLGVRG